MTAMEQFDMLFKDDETINRLMLDLPTRNIQTIRIIALAAFNAGLDFAINELRGEIEK